MQWSANRKKSGEQITKIDWKLFIASSAAVQAPVQASNVRPAFIQDFNFHKLSASWNSCNKLITSIVKQVSAALCPNRIATFDFQ